MKRFKGVPFFMAATALLLLAPASSEYAVRWGEAGATCREALATKPLSIVKLDTACGGTIAKSILGVSVGLAPVNGSPPCIPLVSC